MIGRAQDVNTKIPFGVEFEIRGGLSKSIFYLEFRIESP
jgi:hypothetical protein